MMIWYLNDLGTSGSIGEVKWLKYLYQLLKSFTSLSFPALQLEFENERIKLIYGLPDSYELWEIIQWSIAWMGVYMVQTKKKVSQLVRDQASAPISEQGMALRESVLWMVKVRHKMMHIPLCKLPSARSTVHGKHRACSAMCSWAVHLLELKCSRWDGLE